MHDGLFVGPAIGRVGEHVRARVTTRVWPSQPLVDSLSAQSAQPDIEWLVRTVGTPCGFFMLDYDLAESGGKSMVVIVDDGLADL